MNRRHFVKKLLMAGTAGSLFPALPFAWGQTDYQGKLLLTLQLDGGLDVTSFCDPKENQGGEAEINRWSRSAGIQQAGNIPYAPFAANEAFFEKYYRDMMVVNGVDAQTNSHTTGVLHNWSGRNSEGMPSVTALMAAVKAPTLPLAYLNFGGFGHTRNIVRSTRVSDISAIRNIIFPNQSQWSSENYYRLPGDWERIKALHQQTMNGLRTAPGILEGDRQNRQIYFEAISRAEGIKAFGDMLPNPEEFMPARELQGGFFSTLHQQIQIALLAFKSGVSVSADLWEGGFDTHADHDQGHGALLTNVTDAVDYLWTYAEELNLADRLVLMIGTDFGRTPSYNAGDGKDHWPIASVMFMERQAAYGNQVFGETDGGHNALALSPRDFKRDDQNGVIIKPAHVHKALRRYLGLEGSPITQQFAFGNTEDFDFFS